MQQPIRIGMVAGEASGDALASQLITALRVYLPNVEFVGIGGPKMLAAGFNSLFPMEKLAVRGYAEVLRSYREIVDIRRQLKKYFLDMRPDLFIGVDAPDFNLDLELVLKQAHIKTVHYVSPSIWAWRSERIRKIKRAVSRVLALFPFETKIYEAANIPVTYVGHPFADFAPDVPDRIAARCQLKVSNSAKVFALLPGSRQSELQYMADVFVQTAKRLSALYPEIHFLVPIVSRETRTQFQVALYQNQAEDLPVTILFGHADVAITAADVVLVASGTATLETALLHRPMVITYKMAPLSWRIMKKKQLQPYVGLPNILSGQFVVPEILQDEATAENLAQALVNLDNDKVVYKRITEQFSTLHQRLKQDTNRLAAEAILRELGFKVE